MRRQHGLPAVNHKRVYRIMAAHGLLLVRSPRRRRSDHQHTGPARVCRQHRPVQAMLVEAVERRFGSVEDIPAEHQLELPTDNSMAESFVNTLRRDYIDWMDVSTTAAVLRQLPAAYEHYNRGHPHSALKMMSPIEFRHHQAQREQRREALYCR